ncbi:Uncharacterized protein OBRU01_23678, partial [Operophtera brumata]
MAMAEKKNEYPPGVEANRRLLPFETWEEYLDSLIEMSDLRNLRKIVLPTVTPYVMVSEGTDLEDPFNRELAVRERANRVGILQVYQ